MKPARVLSWTMAVIALLLVSACGNDDVLAPQFEPEIINLQDSFAFQATDIDGISQTISYTWENTGTAANVDQSCSISGGSASINVWDRVGTLVYSGNLANDGTFQTASGVAGTWVIGVTLEDTAGTLNFRLQKQT
jgi:hypothetical protein